MFHLLRKDELCASSEEDCEYRVFRCKECGWDSEYGLTGCDQCPVCGAGWKAIDVLHGDECLVTKLDDSMSGGLGILVRRCFRLFNAKAMPFSLTLSDLTEEEFRVMELIEVERATLQANRDEAAREQSGIKR